MQETIQLERPSLKSDEIVTQNNSKIQLGEYPYTYVRVAVMRTLLIKPQEYERLLKMSVPEIIRFLEETEYKKEIDSLALNYSGTELIDQALNRNIVKTFQKLRRISGDSLQQLIDIYLVRKDMHNLKTILRGRFTSSSQKEIESLLVPAGMLDAEALSTLVKLDSAENILKNKSVSNLLSFDYLKPHLEEFSKSKNIAKLESALDKFYFSSLISFVTRLSSQGILFKEFITTEIEILNIMTLLRLKREGVSKAELSKYLISSQDPRQQRKIHDLLNSPSVDAVIEKLKKLGYSLTIKAGIDDYKKTGSLTTIEMDFKRYLLKKTLLFEHKNPLSVDTILSFMFAKDMEIRNLQILIKCKQFNMPENFIREQLVV
ncbi:ATP synthase A1 subunit C [Candidatus Woesearchaeota archaeon]|nr:ATP synthase A1 subunit C [Candidatus Woesearchaeota archaeon]